MIGLIRIYIMASRDRFCLKVAAPPHSALESLLAVIIGAVSISKIEFVLSLKPMSRACPSVLSLPVHPSVLELADVFRPVCEPQSARPFYLVLAVLLPLDLPFVGESSLEVDLHPHALDLCLPAFELRLVNLVDGDCDVLAFGGQLQFGVDHWLTIQPLPA
jgi:hypothetical protein